MPYPAGHSEEVERKIVDSARQLFNRHGFDNVSIDQIMAGAGLTRGGFYSYFETKSDLYAEVLGCFFTDPNFQSRWEGVEVDLGSEEVGPQVVQAYLSRQHFENVENSCPMVALPGDVGRANKRAKAAFETVFGAMVGVLESGVRGSDGAARECGEAGCGDEARVRAQAIAALCVGGMVVARAMANRAVADDLRDGCMAVALKLGGWTAASKVKKSGKAKSTAAGRG